jgi:hypothetical protein
MKSRRTALHANRILRKEASNNLLAFFSWQDFEKDFSAKFCPKNEATAASPNSNLHTTTRDRK